MTRISATASLLTQPAPVEDFLLRTSRVFFFGGLFAVSLLVFRVGGAITIGDALLMSSAMLLAFSPKIGGPKKYRPRFALALYLVILGGLMASAVSPSPMESLLVLVRVLYVAFVLPWQALRLLDTAVRLSRACTIFALGAAFCGIGTLIQSSLGSSIIPGADVTVAGRYSGFAGHVSDTGGITALAVVAGMAGLGIGSSRMTKLLSLGIIAGGLIGLVLSGSVSGMIAAAAGIIVILMLRGISLGRLILVAAAAAVAIAMANTILADTGTALGPIERFNQTLGLSDSMDPRLNTTASRLETDVLGWESFLQNPFTGVGLDNESSIVDPVSNFAVHNFLIGALHQGGIFFGVGILIAMFVLILPGIRSRSRNSLSVMTLAMMASAVVFCVTAPSFFNRYFWVPMALLAAYTALTEGGLIPGALPRRTKMAHMKSDSRLHSARPRV